MSFTRTHPGGWSFGEGLTSAQLNALDIDHANAIDGVGGGSYSPSSPLTIANLIAHLTGGDLTGSFHALSGSQLIVDQGALLGLGATSSTNGVIPTWAVPQQRTVTQPLVAQPALASGWTPSAFDAIGPATSTNTIFALTKIHDGATLTTVTMFVVITAHSAIPASLPLFNVQRYDLTTGTLVNLSTSSATFPTPGSAGAYVASGALQSWSLTCNQNNVIDTTQYIYFVSLTDENGANSAAGNAYRSMKLAYSGINDQRFQ